MSKTLVVVESPSKAQKIGKMLGSNYVVQASGGHIRDLPIVKGENGYDASTLEPKYEITEDSKTSVKYLKAKLSGCTKILLATDPDREGEAIAWHVAEVLGIKSRMRVKFHATTETAVLTAINNPTPLDVNLVRAQEARRVIDRMVGWLVSSPLSKAIGEKSSAGRVQSPSLGLVVEREREIKSFIKENFFTVITSFSGDPDWEASWDVPGDEGTKCISLDAANRIGAIRDFTVSDFIERDEYESPPAPFDTAVMQQAASVALGFDPEHTMRLAQKLFQGLEEGNGFITYHRTDETNLSDDAFSMIKNYAKEHNLPVIDKKRTFKVSAGAQEAHEAIRPTDFNADTSALSADELSLYQLIHKRALASQLSDVVYSVRRVKLEGADARFTAVGRVLKDKGWRDYGTTAENEEEELSVTNAVPLLVIGQSLTASKSVVNEKWTRSPKRYTKASLIAELKALGIGRPSTYSSAVDGLQKRLYITLDKRYLVPTFLAGKIYDALTNKFAFIRVDFTKKLEEDLDEITLGRKTYIAVVRGVFNTLQTELSALNGMVPAIQPDLSSSYLCKQCNKPLIHRVKPGKGGYDFWGCSGYKDGCKATYSNKDNKPDLSK